MAEARGTKRPSLRKAKKTSLELLTDFVEQLKAWLWSTQQMDTFRTIADAYTSSVDRMAPVPGPAMPRLGIVILGHDVEQSQYPLFRKLKPAGVHFTRVQPKDGVDAILDYASGLNQSTARAKRIFSKMRDPYAAFSLPGLTRQHEPEEPRRG